MRTWNVKIQTTSLLRQASAASRCCRRRHQQQQEQRGTKFNSNGIRILPTLSIKIQLQCLPQPLPHPNTPSSSFRPSPLSKSATARRCPQSSSLSPLIVAANNLHDALMQVCCSQQQAHRQLQAGLLPRSPASPFTYNSFLPSSSLLPSRRASQKVLSSR
jgi:hypothetical protein